MEMMARGCLVLPHSRGRLERSFWECNFAQFMHSGRGERNYSWHRDACAQILSSAGHIARDRQPLPSLLNPNASSSLQLLQKSLPADPSTSPVLWGTPWCFPAPCKFFGTSSPRVTLRVFLWRSSTLCEAVPTVSKKEPFWIVAKQIEKLIHACAPHFHREQA